MPESPLPLAAPLLSGLAESVASRVVELLAGRPARLWTEEEAADYLGVSPRTLYRMRSAREIPHVLLKGDGNRELVRYEPDQIREWALSGGCRPRSDRRTRMPARTAAPLARARCYREGNGALH